MNGIFRNEILAFFLNYAWSLLFSKSPVLCTSPDGVL